MDRKEILLAYAWSSALGLFVGFLAWSDGDDGTSIFKKMLVAVLLPLAMRGLRQFFPSEKDATRSIGTQLEFVILSSALFAACMIVVGPHSNHPLVSLLPEFVKTVVFMTGIYMVIFVLVRRNRSR